MNKILFLGPEGSYSHVVAKELNRSLPDYELQAMESFFTIHRQVLENSNYIGILPFENSTTSNIYENIEFVFDNEINIIGEYFLPIELNLIGHKTANLSDLKTVYSHQKALKQASSFIKNNNLSAIETSSTSKAQDAILNLDNSNFAIGNKSIYEELEIKQKNIGNFPNNKTRFVFVSKSNVKLPNSKYNKISFLCKLKHEKGALLSLLVIILANNINMTKIESKPIPNSEFEYSFLIEGVSNDGKSIDFEEIKSVLNKNSLENRILGIY